MRTILFLAVGVFASTALYEQPASAQAPGPTSIRRAVSTQQAVQPPNSGRQDGRTQKTTAPKVELSPALLSIKELKQPTNEPTIKVLIENLGGLPNEAHRVDLDVILMNRVNGKNSPMFFNVSGVVELPGGAHAYVGSKYEFRVSRPVPVITSGKSAWINIPFVLPDPGTYSLGNNGKPFDECGSQKAFFAADRQIRVAIGGILTKPPALRSLDTQLSPSYLKFMNLPPGKYTQCK